MVCYADHVPLPSRSIHIRFAQLWANVFAFVVRVVAFLVSSACPKKHKRVDLPEIYMAPTTYTHVQFRRTDPYKVDMLRILYYEKLMGKRFAVKNNRALSSSLMAPCNRIRWNRALSA